MSYYLSNADHLGKGGRDWIMGASNSKNACYILKIYFLKCNSNEE